MSENERPERQPVMRFTFGNKVYEATRENSAIFRFVGSSASRDHVYIQQPDEIEAENESGDYRGTYFFGLQEEVFQWMITRGFVAHLNMPEVAECDERAYQTYADRLAQFEASKLPDTFPEEWSQP